ncbi:lysylphosphatidylglycerol synthase transmembrane domain-containing protein [Niabella ginsengisoli]|uniref:Flippase-like domain-containing protein n=1 Tax=Niabella ginsengisoli TaxID=522298 RepID=A0ABS9SES4_9BACT|nr:lysylphosphatidylglycerol synthase transmembrane domain-containing protein [Niabella ginsengisoli]MCH5596867.1 flippase-like domain-containing protein [Niabella ginsengisoli]
MLQTDTIFTLKVKVNKNIKIFINYFLGPLLFIWLAWSIYKQISSQAGLEESLSSIKSSLASYNIFYLIATIFLMLVNWSLEAYKWMLAVKRIQQISFVRAFKAIFSGISFSISTPNSIGEYVGRVLYMSEGNRIKAISLTIVANMSQLIVTFLMGVVALFLLKNDLIAAGIVSYAFANAFLWVSVIIVIILLLFYFRLPWLVKIIDKLPQISKFSWAIEAVEHVSATLLVKFLSLSVVRFLVFSLQYFLLFELFEVNVTPVQSWMGISVMFLVMAIIPTIALFTDLGLKNELSIQLMGLFTVNHLGVSLTSLAIWLINLVFPALIGSLLILGIKNIF